MPSTQSDHGGTKREMLVRRFPLAAMLMALGVLLPQLFHAIGLGASLLPMFLPVLAGALLLPLRLALNVAFLTPLLSWLLTGMPPLSPPVLPLLLIELPVITVVSGILHRRAGWRPIFSLTAALVIDRILLYGMLLTMTELLGFRHAMLSTALVLLGLPGVVLQLLVLPPAHAFIVRRYPQLEMASPKGAVS
ncbi:hypothetical protein KQI65_13555 [bacterium]|nr:hypothetical protein [bacterium]